MNKLLIFGGAGALGVTAALAQGVSVSAPPSTVQVAPVPPNACPVSEASRWNGSNWVCIPVGLGGGGFTRIVPTADLKLYVAPPSTGTGNCVVGAGYWPGEGAVTVCGNDAGLGTKVSPYASPQKAADVLMADYDFQCRWRPTIQLAAGNAGTQWYYSGALISGRLVGQCGTVPPLISTAPGPWLMGKYLPFTLRGDPANILGAFIFPGFSGRAARPCVSITEGALKIEGLACDTGSGSALSDGMDIFANSFVELGHVQFGACTYLCMGIAWNSAMLATGPITISGSAGIAFAQIAHSTVQGNSDSGSPTVPITILNNPTFAQAMWVVDHSVVYGLTFTITGSFQGGPLFSLHRGGFYQE